MPYTALNRDIIDFEAQKGKRLLRKTFNYASSI